MPLDALSERRALLPADRMPLGPDLALLAGSLCYYLLLLSIGPPELDDGSVEADHARHAF